MSERLKTICVALFVSAVMQAHTHTVKVTAYMPTVAQCNAMPTVTADGSRIDFRMLKAGRLRWCAVSRDLLKCHPYGSRIYIEGRGWYTVHDTTNKRLRMTVDILVHPSAKGFCEKGVVIR